jgi:phytol kinase
VKVVIASICYLAWFGLVEVTARWQHLGREVTRKWVHLTAGISVAMLPLVMSLREIAYLGIVFVPALLLSRHFRVLRSIHDVARKTWGEVYFPLSVVPTALFAPDSLAFTYGVLTMAISDVLACVVGQRWGRGRHWHARTTKTVAGSAAFFVSTLTIGVILTLSATHQLFASLTLSLAVAIVGTVVEAGAKGGLDNLLIPPSVVGVVWVFRVIGLIPL